MFCFALCAFPSAAGVLFNASRRWRSGPRAPVCIVPALRQPDNRSELFVSWLSFVFAQSHNFVWGWRGSSGRPLGFVCRLRCLGTPQVHSMSSHLPVAVNHRAIKWSVLMGPHVQELCCTCHVCACACVPFCSEESEERNVLSGSLDVCFTFFHAVQFFLQACGSPIREIWRSA